MISIFENSFTEEPLESISFEKFIQRIREGEWQKVILKLRSSNDKAFKRLKRRLAAVTISGKFRTRVTIVKHSGLICLDIDSKDNPNMRVQDLIDSQCLAQFVSAGGKGVKIVYRCTETTDPAEHRRIYDAAVERLRKKGITLKIDPLVKAINSLQYVSYDPNAFYFPKTKLVIKPLAPIKLKKVIAPTTDIKKELDELQYYIDSVGEKDVTHDYENWVNIAFGLSYSLDEAGREAFHNISRYYNKDGKTYNSSEVDDFYTACLERKHINGVERPVTIATVYQILGTFISKVTLKHLTKKFNKGHAIGEGEDVEHGDLIGLVRYKMFLFKKIFDKENNTLIDLYPVSINLNEFEDLLKVKGFYRYGKTYVHLVNNIVEQCDEDDILRIITKYIVNDGSYNFSYNKIEFHFTWEELVHKWREIRAHSNTYNQISAGLEHWHPELLKDTADESFIPYRNGVVRVTANKIDLIPYEKLQLPVWRERILPRNFRYDKTPGMFEDFFGNVCSRGKKAKFKLLSEEFKRSYWYYGYMLHCCKRKSNARAWLLYDINPGNNGGTGKTMLGYAVGCIRNVVTIDGKRIDFDNRFAFQTVKEWTDVVFIDDPDKRFSLVPLFNIITGDLDADQKGIAPIVKSVKIMIASNWILESEGESEKRRQFVTQLDDFYVRYSREHKDTLTPIVDLHGKEFFTDWDEDDWAKFDSFSVRALQFYFSSEAPPNTIIGNSEQIKFIQNNERELFFELSNVFINNLHKTKDNGYAVPQNLLVQTIREHNSNIGSGIAGRIAREFLRAIGVKKTTFTSIVVGGMNRNAYKFITEFKDLNFGEFAENLPTPKFLKKS